MVAVPSIRRSSLEQFGHSSSRASRLLKHATFFHIETKTRENELKSALVQNFILYRKLFFFFQRRISLFRSKVTRIEEGEKNFVHFGFDKRCTERDRVRRILVSCFTAGSSIYIDLFLAWPKRIFLSDVVSCLRADIFIPLMRLPRLNAITRDESKFIGFDRFLFNGRIVLKEVRTRNKRREGHERT